MHTPSGWRGWFGLKTWYREWFEGYFASDYTGIVQEFMAEVGERKGKANGGCSSGSNGACEWFGCAGANKGLGNFITYYGFVR